MLCMNYIEPTQSDWASPSVFAQEMDELIRFSIEYRKLNAVTVKDTYQISRMEKCLDLLDEAQIF